MAFSRDTICALATGAPPSAISIVRVSGPLTASICEDLLSCGVPLPRRATLSQVKDRQGDLIDTGLVTYMPGPASYTGEDTLELSLHGGRIVTELAFAALFACGARIAQPGEFTRRAFEAGKLDLTQAEAIADLIDAESVGQHGQALKQLDGALGNLYAGWRARLVECLALLEGSIDFPDEDDVPQNVRGPVRASLDELIGALEEALTEGNLTERIREGFRVAIVGQPNVGKSTLLNRIAGREAAIVTDIPGTTRDLVEVRLVLGGYLVLLADTAGLRESEDLVEREGIRRALAAAEDADIRIHVVDAVGSREPSLAVRVGDLVVANKIDAVSNLDVSRETIPISAKMGDGIERLRDALKDAIASIVVSAQSPVITRARHRQGILVGLQSLYRARAGVAAGVGAELVSEDLRLATRQLAALTGAIDAENVLGSVFSSFCIGK